MGLLDGALSDAANTEFYLLLLSPYYLVLMFYDFDPKSVRAGQLFFGVSTAAVVLGLVFGPLEPSDRQFLLMVSTIFGQLTILLVFAFLKRAIGKLAASRERTKNYQEIARLSEEARYEAEKAREKSEIAEQEAIAASQVKSQFIANMSHELRTPLNAIIGFSDMISMSAEKYQLHEKLSEYNGYIKKAGSNLLSVVNDLLDVAKIEAGKMELWESDVFLREVVDEIIVRMEPLCQKKNLTIEVSPELEQLAIVADRRMVGQIIQNLISNAIKFSNKGESISIDGCITAHDEARLTVTDTGIGMSTEVLATVMQPFVQGQDSYRKAMEGTGLGLYLVDTMMTLHNGSVALHSRPDFGTSVSITFPKERTQCWVETIEPTSRPPLNHKRTEPA